MHLPILVLLVAITARAELVVHHSGSVADSNPVTRPGLLLAGGGGDVDAAMSWLLECAGGGDVVVLRASGSDGYNTYLQEELGVPVNSVRTLVFDSRDDADDPQAAAWIRKAELVFIAGGDQSKYVRFWKGTPVQAALQEHLLAGKPAGGTSAGLAVLGQYAYSAMHEADLTSALALADPGSPLITLEKDFLSAPPLVGILTDSHFRDRDRLGRLIAMLARIATDGTPAVAGIGIDERTALCIGSDGIGQIHSTSGGVVTLVRLAGDPASPGEMAALVHEVGAGSRIEFPGLRVSGESSGYHVYASAGSLRRFPHVPGEAPRPAPPTGQLFIVGGGWRASNRALFAELMETRHLHESGHVGIIAAASGRPVKYGNLFRDVLAGYGMNPDQIELLPLAVVDDPSTTADESVWRDNAASTEVADRIRGLALVWFTGGDQSRIMDILRPGGVEASPVYRALLDQFWQGGAIGGTSAGAAVQSAVMILGGSSPGALRHGLAQTYAGPEQQESGALVLGRGAGFFPHGIIDQHFDRKARLGRLVVALLASRREARFGFGIDEDTALVYDAATDSAVVRGPATVVMVDATDAREADGTISGIRLSVLSAGDTISWPGPRVDVNSLKKPTIGSEYLSISNPASTGIMDPYGGRLADILGALLTDNSAASEVVSRIQYTDGASRTIRFSADSRTFGYWEYLDGQRDSYSVLNALLEIGPMTGPP
jgi:cyanophycinase